jgi:hypothetical protein
MTSDRARNAIVSLTRRLATGLDVGTRRQIDVIVANNEWHVAFSAFGIRSFASRSLLSYYWTSVIAKDQFDGAYGWGRRHFIYKGNRSARFLHMGHL